jgi:hypothetical protein
MVPTFKSQLSAACTTLRFVEVDKAMRPIKGNAYEKTLAKWPQIRCLRSTDGSFISQAAAKGLRLALDAFRKKEPKYQPHDQPGHTANFHYHPVRVEVSIYRPT